MPATPPEQLLASGVALVPCLTPAQVKAVRRDLRATVAAFPEFQPMSATEVAAAVAESQPLPPRVMGGFSALGNPASFHNPLVRQLRQWAMHAAVTHLFQPLLAAQQHADKTHHEEDGQEDGQEDGASPPRLLLEQIIDRMLLRPRGVAPSKESWHRDVAVNTQPGDRVFGGWINLDSVDQHFAHIPGSQLVRPIGASHKSASSSASASSEEKIPLGADGQGFAKLSKEEAKALDAKQAVLAVPPGHLVVFDETLLHCVYGSRATRDVHRLFIAWRLTQGGAPTGETAADSGLASDGGASAAASATPSPRPLNPPSEAALKKLLEEQAVVPLKSGQMPPMYAQLHWTNWRDKIKEFSQHLKPCCLEERVLSSGKDKGETLRVVKRFMGSLKDYELPLYPAYTDREVAMHLPNTSWKVLVPGSADTREKVRLYPKRTKGQKRSGPDADADSSESKRGGKN